MESAAGGTGMVPVAAVLTVFALVFSFIAWLRLLRASFRENALLGLIAFFLPPLALLILLPRWQQERETFETLLFAGAALIFISIATFL